MVKCGAKISSRKEDCGIVHGPYDRIGGVGSRG